MNGVSFWVAGTPKGQPRQRHFAMKINGKYTARAYTPGTAEEWKSAIAIAAKEAGLAGEQIQGMVWVEMCFFFARPKSHYRANGEVKPGAPKDHTQKPDIDNVVKAALDALTQIGVWRDDSQINNLAARKIWTESNSETLFDIFYE